MGRIDYETETMVIESGVKYAHYSHDFAHDRITDPRGVAPALTSAYHASGNLNVVAFHHNAQAAQLPTAARDTSVADALTCSQGAAVAYAIQAGALRTNPNSGPDGMQVRRLTPRECERLQGFPDLYTAIPKAADGPRYKALGNSMAVPVMHWIGRQIDFAWRFF